MGTQGASGAYVMCMLCSRYTRCNLTPRPALKVGKDDVTIELSKVMGEIGELRHQYQAQSEALGKLLEYDLVGGVVQLQLNLDAAKVSMQELLANKLKEIEERIANLPAPKQVKMQRQMQADRLNDIEARLVKLEKGYKAMGAMYTHVCDMHDCIQSIVSVPQPNFHLAIQLAEKLASIRPEGGELNTVTVVSLREEEDATTNAAGAA